MYGKPALVTPAIAIPAVLPTTGSNDNLFILAASMLALGVVVYLVTLVLTRKSRQTSEI
ncbi:MAG: LPXTG cell wall anchor domain-containing protein [Candidatus Saccharimonadales bacterium]